MSSGQWRVFGLIMLLFFMEVIINPSVSNIFNAAIFVPFKQAIA